MNWDKMEFPFSTTMKYIIFSSSIFEKNIFILLIFNSYWGGITVNFARREDYDEDDDVDDDDA